MATYQQLYDIISKATGGSAQYIKGTDIPLSAATVGFGQGGEVEYWYNGERVAPEIRATPYTDYAPNASYGPTQVDPNFTQDVKMRILNENLANQTNMVANNPNGMDGNAFSWSPAVWTKEARDVWEVLNAPNLEYLDGYFKNVADYRANESEPNFMEKYAFPATVGAITGGALTGMTLPTANALMAGASFTPTFAGGPLSGLMNTLTGQAASTVAGQGASAAAGGTAAANGGNLSSADFLFPGEADVAADAWKVSNDPNMINWDNLKTADVSGQLPLNSFPGQTASLAGLAATLGIKDAAGAKALKDLIGGNGSNQNQDNSRLDSLKRILSGEGNADDWLKLGGAVAPAAIGAFASNQQANAIRDLSNQHRADRLPFLNEATKWLKDPNAYISGPGQAGLKGVLNALSVQGNPLESPNALATATEAGMRDWRNAVQGMGALGLGGDNLQAQLGLNAINADSNVWQAAGAGVADVFNPPSSLEQILKSLQKARLVS